MIHRVANIQGETQRIPRHPKQHAKAHWVCASRNFKIYEIQITRGCSLAGELIFVHCFS